MGNRAVRMSRILLATSKGSSGEESIAEARLLPAFWGEGYAHAQRFCRKSAQVPERKRDDFRAVAKDCKKVQKSAQECEKKDLECRGERRAT